MLGTVAGGYIWAMAQDPVTSEVWLAVGSPAALYRLDSKDQLEPVQALAAQNSLAVTFLPGGDLLVGTQGPGLVYRLNPRKPQQIEVIFQAPQDEVRQFIADPTSPVSLPLSHGRARTTTHAPFASHNLYAPHQ